VLGKATLAPVAISASDFIARAHERVYGEAQAFGLSSSTRGLVVPTCGTGRAGPATWLIGIGWQRYIDIYATVSWRSIVEKPLLGSQVKTVLRHECRQLGAK
jgi:hypothetical protein